MLVVRRDIIVLSALILAATKLLVVAIAVESYPKELFPSDMVFAALALSFALVATVLNSRPLDPNRPELLPSDTHKIVMVLILVIHIIAFMLLFLAATSTNETPRQFLMDNTAIASVLTASIVFGMDVLFLQYATRNHTL